MTVNRAILRLISAFSHCVVLHHCALNADTDNTISGINSDYYRVYTDTSSLGRAVGNGVFAKSDIPANTIICEYRGTCRASMYVFCPLNILYL